MAKLYFKMGTMNSGKSIDILKTAHNYEEQGKDVYLFTSSLDDRDGIGSINSRTGLSRKAHPLKHDDNVFDIVKDLDKKIYCVLIDEAQFLTKEQVYQLTEIVDVLGIPTMAFGLKNDFSNNLFEGSKSLLIYSDKIEEIKTICWFCDKKATMNLRIKDSKPVYSGEQIQIGGNESYLPVCRKCYKNPVI